MNAPQVQFTYRKSGAESPYCIVSDWKGVGWDNAVKLNTEQHSSSSYISNEGWVALMDLF